jgi:hypothetical protein
MKIRIQYVLPAMLLLAGCATTTDSSYRTSAATPTVAPPQRVSAVSDAVGAKMDAMMATQPAPGSNVTR